MHWQRREIPKTRARIPEGAASDTLPQARGSAKAQYKSPIDGAMKIGQDPFSPSRRGQLGFSSPLAVTNCRFVGSLIGGEDQHQVIYAGEGEISPKSENSVRPFPSSFRDRLRRVNTPADARAPHVCVRARAACFREVGAVQWASWCGVVPWAEQ